MPSKMQQRQKLRRENALTRGLLDAQVLTEQRVATTSAQPPFLTAAHARRLRTQVA